MTIAHSSITGYKYSVPKICKSVCVCFFLLKKNNQLPPTLFSFQYHLLFLLLLFSKSISGGGGIKRAPFPQSPYMHPWRGVCFECSWIVVCSLIQPDPQTTQALRKPLNFKKSSCLTFFKAPSERGKNIVYILYKTVNSLHTITKSHETNL